MSAFMEYLKSRIGSIYVWGAQGQNVLAQTDPYGWILAMEKNNEANAKRAYNLFLKRKSEGISPILAYDCSGLIVAFLLNVGILKADRTAAALYSMCDIKMDNPANLLPGDFVCHYNSKKGYITHIGTYIGNGKVIEAKGRDYGVVETDLNNGYDWNRFGRLSALEPYLKDEPVEPMSLAVCKPVLSGDAYAAMQEALNSLGYTDTDGNALTVDGKWGKRSRQAYDKCVAANLGTISFGGTLHIEGVCDKQMTLKEE
jgi:hypothetical protein